MWKRNFLTGSVPPNPRKRRVLLKKAPSHTSSLGSLTSFLNFPKYNHLFLSGGRGVGGWLFVPKRWERGVSSSPNLQHISLPSPPLLTPTVQLLTLSLNLFVSERLSQLSPPHAFPMANPPASPRAGAFVSLFPLTQHASHPIHFPTVIEISYVLKDPLKASSLWKLIFFIFIEVQLVYNVVFISSVQKRDWVICVCVCVCVYSVVRDSL